MNPQHYWAALLWYLVGSAVRLNVALFLFNVFFPMYPADGSKLLVTSLMFCCGLAPRKAANVLLFVSALRPADARLVALRGHPRLSGRWRSRQFDDAGPDGLHGSYEPNRGLEDPQIEEGEAFEHPPVVRDGTVLAPPRSRRVRQRASDQQLDA